MGVPPELAVFLSDYCKGVNCAHCVIKGHGFKGVSLTKQALGKVLEEAKTLSIASVCFSGGEPFDYDLKYAVEIATKNNLFVSEIITNASFAKNKQAASANLAKIKRAGFHEKIRKNSRMIPSITISMDLEHQKFVPMENIVNIILALLDMYGDSINISINYTLFPNEILNNIKIFRLIELLNAEMKINAEYISDTNVSRLRLADKVICVNLAKISYEGNASKLNTKTNIGNPEFVHVIPDNKETTKNTIYILKNDRCSWLMPREVASYPAVMPWGDIHFCCYFGFSRPLKIGHISNKNCLKEALQKAETDVILKTLFNSGTYGLYKLVKAVDPSFKFKPTYGKCGVCNQILRDENLVKDIRGLMERNANYGVPN